MNLYKDAIDKKREQFIQSLITNPPQTIGFYVRVVLYGCLYNEVNEFLTRYYSNTARPPSTLVEEIIGTLVDLCDPVDNSHLDVPISTVLFPLLRQIYANLLGVAVTNKNDFLVAHKDLILYRFAKLHNGELFGVDIPADNDLELLV